MSEPAFKPYIEKIHPYQPGKPISEVARELGLSDVRKLASNENPLGFSPVALDAIKNTLDELHRYPDGSSFYLTKRLAADLDLPEDQIIFGNGSNEIIELVARGFLSEGDEVISSAASFLVYPILTQSCGGKYISVPAKNHTYDLKAIADAVTDKTKVIFIANPNNPTGTYVSHADVEKFVESVPENVVICFDEAYFDFVDAEDFPKVIEYVREKRSNIILFRTFSKAHGLAGLRVGYACASPKMIGYLHKIRQPFNVNLLAQVAALASLEDSSFLTKTQELNRVGKEYFYKSFSEMGLEFIESQTNFVLLNVGRAGKEVCGELLKLGMIVRDMAAYELPEWIRVTIGTEEENTLFIEKLKQVIGS